jgi:hypothetical protein
MVLPKNYDSVHTTELKNLACRAAGRDTVAAALAGLVDLVGGTATPAAARPTGRLPSTLGCRSIAYRLYTGHSMTCRTSTSSTFDGYLVLENLLTPQEPPYRTPATHLVPQPTLPG